MKLFIFQYVNQVSDSYHSEGGLVIISPDRESAQALADRTEHVELGPEDWESVREYDGLFANEWQIFIFRDAGCC